VVLDAVSLERMELSTWRTVAGDLDVLRDLRFLDGEHLTFEELVSRSVGTTFAASPCG